MDSFSEKRLNRRDFERLALAAALPASLSIAALSGRSAGIALAQESEESGTPTLARTPPCGDEEELAATVPQTAGPFYTPETPERRSLLEPGMTGTRLTVSGYVYSTDCQPIPGALLDFWQADDAGVYDNVGYRLRGHQFADGEGRFELETIVPGLYPGRTRHIHVIAQVPDGAMLTTQLYFPDEPANATDGIFDPALVMDVSEESDATIAVYTFVL
jgi:protocatechuate 3,4-dioxygenase beta subunit